MSKPTKEDRANMTREELLRAVWLLDEAIENLESREKHLLEQIECLTHNCNALRETINTQYDNCKKELEKYKWVTVSERLPEEHEESKDIYDINTLAAIDTRHYKASELVLVTVRDCENDKIFVCDDITVDGKWSNFSEYEVIAWQPLPQPYKEGNNG